MTAGGLIQIITATGEQDLYLTGNPEITFFKTVYRRHTNFAKETYEESFYSGDGFGKSSRCFLKPLGDLISKLTLYINIGTLNPQISDRNSKPCIKNTSKINDDGELVECDCAQCKRNENDEDVLTYGWINSLGHALIQTTWLEIGGQRIDKQYGEWFEIWSELTQTEEKRAGYNQAIGKVDPESYRVGTFTDAMELYIPLNFWFCRNIGLALPVLALHYHNIELAVDFRKFNECWVSNMKNAPSPNVPDFEASVLIEYIYLDIEERKQFYEESQIYLIEQLQYSENHQTNSSSVPINLYFNHPVKELVWVLQRNDVTGPPNGVFPDTNIPIGNDWFNFSTSRCQNTSIVNDTFFQGMIQFNGVDRLKQYMMASYFRWYQPYYHHTRIPSNFIYVYSFGLRPEELNPTGQMNFSRIDSARLLLQMKNNRDYTNYNIRVYAVNYNILIISSGLGGLLFSN